MRGVRRSVPVVVLVVLSSALLVVGAPSVAGGADDAPAPVERQASFPGEGEALQTGWPDQTVRTVLVTQEFAALPDRPGHVRVVRRLEIPDNVRSIRTELPEDAAVTATSGGFRQDGPDRYAWADGSATPSITYTLPVNETGEVSGPEGTGGRYLFADVGDWGLFPRPSAPTEATYVGSAIRFEQRTAVDGPGAAGDWLVYVGAGREYREQAHGQNFRLVEPAAADLAVSRSAVFESVADASASLQVGQRDEEVLMVAAPTSVDWAVEGLQTGDSDLYVTADERLDDANNVWLHEYVHTRQDFNLTRETRWLREATAAYYAALLSLEQERIGFDEFRRVVGTGSDGRFDSTVLSDPDTWIRGSNYRKGGLVIGELDRRLRLATDSGTDFQAVFRQLNERRRPLDADDFPSLVRRIGTDGVGDDARRFTTTTRRPSTWDAAAHSEAFGRLPPRIRTALPGDADGLAYRVAGPYRNRTLGEPPFVLVRGERVTVDVRLRNVGGTPGTYNLTYGLGDGPRQFQTGRLDVDESATETVSVGADALGDQQLHVGDQALPVTVVEPAELAAIDGRVEPATVQAGETVDVVVDLRNPSDRPGERALNVTLDGRLLASETVRLDASETATVRLPVTIEETGSHRLAVGNASVTVRVQASGGLGVVGPGVGPVGTVIALLLLATLALARALSRER